MDAALKTRTDAVPAAGFERYWPLCLAVALLAVALFYVTLQGLVRESAARAAMLTAPPVAKAAADSMPRFVPEPPVAASSVPATAPATLHAQPAAVPIRAATAVVEVNKCVTPTGEAAYSDGPCPEGSQASTLRLPRNMNVAARL